MNHIEALARERVSKKYESEVLKRLSPWERELLVLIEEAKLENEDLKGR